jgi:hypothetical protein
VKEEIVNLRSLLRIYGRCVAYPFMGICLFPLGVGAQSIQLQHRPYVETFVGKPKVSGNLLVGLRFGGVEGKFDPKAVGLYITPRVGGRPACVDISTRDGLYYAQNMYSIPAASGNLMPFETETAHPDTLSQYNIKEIAVTVRLVSDCNAPDVGDIVPAVINSQSRLPAVPSRTLPLVALVNAEPDRLKVALLRNGVEAATAECRSDPNAVQIAFTSSCEFSGSPGLAPGNYDLLIRVRERFASRDSHFSVQVP